MTPSASTPGIPPPAVIPPPPGHPATLDLLLHTWPAGQTLHRCFDAHYGSRQFYASAASPGRFHPFEPAGGTDPLPVLYAANDIAGALSETVFHDVPVRGGPKNVPYAKLVHRLVVELASARDLTLIDLTSDGLRRLGLTRSELIESDARTYAQTAAWAQTLHAHPTRPDGLIWVSRQHDTSLAVVLFGDRIDDTDLVLPPTAVPLTLGAGAGLDATCEAADRAGITITGLPA